MSELLSPALASACKSRQSLLQQALKSGHVDALLLGNEKDIQYLTGFVGHESLAMVALQSPAAIIISDSRYDEYLQPWRKTGAAEIVMGIRHRLPEAVRQVCESRRIKRLGVQAEHLTFLGKAKLAAAVGAERLVETAGLVGALRMKKDAVEVAALRRAIDVAQQGVAAAVEKIGIGMTENEFSALLEYEVKMRGSQAASFTPIIGAGANSSIIHHSTGSTPIQPGALLVDWGAMVDGLCSDLTRTFGIGEMPRKLREVYAVVLEAQLAAIDAIAPGKTCAEIDAVARNRITKAGYGEFFGHGLGHGLGMDVHEEPYFNDLSTNVRLEPGMVMTVEPGVYLPGVGGVRIEDDVLVTDDGVDVLSDWPKDLESMIVETAAARA